MARKPKMFSGVIHHNGKQVNCIIVATSQKQAAEMSDESISRIRDYYCVSESKIELEVVKGFDSGVWVVPLDHCKTPENYKKIK